MNEKPHVSKPPVSTWGRLRRLAGKELRETLRDRRTVITLIMMPVLVYPILSIVFRTVLLSGLDLATGAEDGLIYYSIIIDEPLDAKNVVLNGQEVSISNLLLRADQLVREKQIAQLRTDRSDQSEQKEEPVLQVALLAEQDIKLIDKSKATIESIIEAGDAHLGMRLSRNSNTENRGLIEFELIYKSDSPAGQEAAAFMLERIETANLLNLQERLRIAVVRPGMNFNEIKKQSSQLAEITLNQLPGEEKPEMSIASLIPLILILMTITGAVYPAIDLTAGERERGTLEALVAAPIPRRLILLSKFVAVLTVAVLTATLNMIGMLSTVFAFGLDQYLLTDASLTVNMIAQIFVLMILFAAFFSAVLLAITSFARSFKEAQAYLIPVILLSLGPGIAGLMPTISLEGPAAVVPMLNIVLLSRDVMQADVSATAATIAVVSTLLYGAVAITIAARLFGTDAVLYGSQGSWRDIFTRPKTPTETATVEAAVFCLVFLFPVNFIIITLMVRFGEAWSFEAKLFASSISTIICFGLVPLAVAASRRVRLRSGFGFNLFNPLSLIIAGLLGISLWPLVMGLVEVTHQFYTMVSGVDAAQDWAERLVQVTKEHSEKIKTIPVWSIVLMLGVIPAFCEECFFRGFLLRSLMKHQSPWNAILVTALCFGVFHILAASVISLDRFMPTMLMGLVLGFVCWKTGSIIPSIILHCIHNTTVSLLGVYHEKIDQISWLPFTSESVPWWIYVVSAVSGAAGLWLIYMLGSYAAREPAEEALADN